MLHIGILPHHHAWADMLANLAFVVVDEAHVYRGVFGSHVGNVLRRLRRAAEIHGSQPRFLMASATIANPVRCAEGLTGLRDFRLVDNDGGPRAARRIAMWNPPLLDEELGVRGSALRGGRGLLGLGQLASNDLLHEVAQGVELILRHARTGSPRLAERIAPYRAGYTPRSARTSSAGSLKASCSAWWPRTRSSSGSTSASSTRRSA